jgi:hypothetical protein
MKRENLEGMGVDGNTIIKWISKKRTVGVEWIDLA